MSFRLLCTLQTKAGQKKARRRFAVLQAPVAEEQRRVLPEPFDVRAEKSAGVGAARHHGGRHRPCERAVVGRFRQICPLRDV